jgi:hypothetical protein
MFVACMHACLLSKSPWCFLPAARPVMISSSEEHTPPSLVSSTSAAKERRRLPNGGDAIAELTTASQIFTISFKCLGGARVVPIDSRRLSSPPFRFGHDAVKYASCSPLGPQHGPAD